MYTQLLIEFNQKLRNFQGVSSGYALYEPGSFLVRLVVFANLSIAQDPSGAIQTSFPCRVLIIISVTKKMSYLLVIILCLGRIRCLQNWRALISNRSFAECFPSTCWECLSSTFAFGDRFIAHDLLSAMKTRVPYRAVTTIPK